MKNKAWSYQEVKDFLYSEGYVLKSNEYKNSKTKILVECPVGHEYMVVFNNFKSGCRCPECAEEKRASKRRLSFGYVKEQIEKENYLLLTDQYKNDRTKLKLQCPEGHVFYTTYGHFRNGHRCPLCYGSKKLLYEDVKNFIEDKGYKLLSEEYINTDTKLKLQCPEGHSYWTRLYNFKTGCRCPECAREKSGDIFRLTFEYVRNEIEKEGYVLLSNKYENATEKLKLKCPEGHIIWMDYNHFKGGRRCFKCFCKNNTSKPEKEIQEFVLDVVDNVIFNDRKTIYNENTGYYLELDLFFPDQDKAIEFNGKYWHSFENRKDKDKLKMNECKDKGIELMVIDEKEWINNKEIVLENIKSFLNWQKNADFGVNYV